MKDMTYIRRILKIKRRDMISNVRIIDKHKLTPTRIDIKKKARLICLGHLIHTPMDRWLKKIFNWKLIWKVSRGDQNVDRVDMICEDLEEFNQLLNELIEIAKDRTR